MVLAGFTAMMLGMQCVAVRNVGMMAGFFVVAGLMVSGGFAVVFGCGFVMIGSFMMMIGAFVCH